VVEMRRQTAASGGRWRGGDGSVAAAWWVGVVVLGGHLLSCAQAGLLESNPGLAYNFYQKSCPSVDSIVRSVTWAQVAANPALPARLLRLHFHDCFVKVRPSVPSLLLLPSLSLSQSYHSFICSFTHSLMTRLVHHLASSINHARPQAGVGAIG